MLDTNARKFVQPLLDMVAAPLIKLGFSANAVTIMALVFGVFSAGAVCLQWNWAAIALLWLSGLFDAVDGTVARKTGSSSPVGTLLDIVFDRIVEILLLMALIYVMPDLAVHVAVVLSTIIISMCVFLTVGASAKNKVNTEAKKSFYYQVGLTERSEALIMITLSVLLVDYRGIVLLVFAGMILFTAGQRFIEAIRILRE